MLQTYQTCLEQGSLGLAKGYLFKAYQKNPRNHLILEHLNQLNQKQIDLPNTVLQTSSKSRVSLNLFTLNEFFILLLSTACLLLFSFLFLPSILLPFFLALFILSLSSFTIKAYTNLFSKYAVITSPYCLAFTNKHSRAVDIFYEGLIVNVSTIKGDMIKISNTKHKNIWIAKQHLWIIQ